MKLPYDPNYSLMKLPYSTVEFSCDLTHNPKIVRPEKLFGYFPEEVFMFWPSSWNYPDGLLRDAFALLACLPEQRYRTLVVIPYDLTRKVEQMCEEKEISIETEPDDLEDKHYDSFYFSWRFPYSLHDYCIPTDVMRTNYFERNASLCEVSQGTEIYSLKPEAFDTIQNKEYDFETRILEPFMYKLAGYCSLIVLDVSWYEYNIHENLERTEEVKEREGNRVTPMKPRW
jgi:hypothetical protein